MKQICQMARARGIEVIVDGAHAFAQFPFKHEDLDCDYYGTSSAQMAPGAHRHRLAVRSEIEDPEDLADDGRAIRP